MKICNIISSGIISLLMCSNIIHPVHAEDTSFAENISSISNQESITVAINEENFPDRNFREIVSLNYDKNNDNMLSSDEISNVTSINVNSKNITDLKGIEYFTALKSLNACNNNITSIDLSKNTELLNLSLEHNSCLNSIDVSWNKQLTTLDVLNCGLSELDISNNINLYSLFCHLNNLTNLYLGNNTKLKELCCWGNNLTSLDISNNTSLAYLYCYNNQISELFLGSCPGLVYLNCSNNNLTTLDISNNTELQYLYCDKNNIASLDISTIKCLTDLQADDSTSVTGEKRIPISLIGFDRKESYISGVGDISEGWVYENTSVGLHLFINEYINHELYINDEKYCLDNCLNGDGYVFYDTFAVSDFSSLKIELKEEPWTDERLSDYFRAEVDDEIKLYYYNSYLKVISRQITTGDYVRKERSFCLRIDPSFFTEDSFITINGEKAELILNYDGLYELWNYGVPDASSNKLEVKLILENEINDIIVTDKNVIVIYSNGSTEEYLFNTVPANIVDEMDISKIIAFVSAFSDTDENMILSDGQIRAIDLVLNYDCVKQ